MLKFKMKTGVAFFLLCMMQSNFAQVTTEIYIPIGQSPGLSGKHTTLGIINAVDTQNRTLSLSDAATNYTVRIGDNTQVWLDQSKLKLNNKKVSIADIREGMRAEVKYIKNDKGNAIEWIKVQPTE